jgi:hypothetical protein
MGEEVGMIVTYLDGPLRGRTVEHEFPTLWTKHHTYMDGGFVYRHIKRSNSPRRFGVMTEESAKRWHAVKL